MLDLLRQTSVPIESIRIDGGTQSRVRIDPDTVADYADAMQGGAEFPPVIVYYDGNQYWLADGFHRLQAWASAWPERVGIPAEVRQGDRREAVLHSVGANDAHGLRRTNEDKRRAVLRLLEDEEWGKWSNVEIARRCHVSDMTVKRIRDGLSPQQSGGERTYTTKHGTTATMRTGNIGRSAAAESSLGLILASNGRDGGLMAEQPQGVGVGKLLVDWTDDDWAAHNAEIEAAIQEAADVPAAHVTTAPATPGSKVERLYAAIETATAWLSEYRNKDGITWRGLSENQVHHANSPCYLAFVAAYPDIEHPKEALATALVELRKQASTKVMDTQPPANAAVKSDAERHRQTIQTAVEDCQRILSRPAYLDALSHTTKDARREHEMILSGLKYLLKLIEK